MGVEGGGGQDGRGRGAGARIGVRGTKLWVGDGSGWKSHADIGHEDRTNKTPAIACLHTVLYKHGHTRSSLLKLGFFLSLIIKI